MARIIYTGEMHTFIQANYKGLTSRELAEKVNAEFGTAFTTKQMQTYKKNRKMKSGVPHNIPQGWGPVFPAEINKFIRENYKGVGYHAMVKLIEKEFGAQYKPSQIKNFYGNNKLDSGLNGRFQKGNVPVNKGKKGCWAPGCEKTWFKKGNRPHCQAEVGAESVIDGYTYVKIAQPNVWKQKHHIIWEAENGPIPEGCVILFRDGDRANIELSNLMMVERRILSQLNKRDLIGMKGDLKDTAVAIAKVKVAVGDAKRKRKKAKKDVQDKK